VAEFEKELKDLKAQKDEEHENWIMSFHKLKTYHWKMKS
jgi:hypothetical protein